jgi:hypothetical protein
VLQHQVSSHLYFNLHRQLKKTRILSSPCLLSVPCPLASPSALRQHSDSRKRLFSILKLKNPKGFDDVNNGASSGQSQLRPCLSSSTHSVSKNCSLTRSSKGSYFESGPHAECDALKTEALPQLHPEPSLSVPPANGWPNDIQEPHSGHYAALKLSIPVNDGNENRSSSPSSSSPPASSQLDLGRRSHSHNILSSFPSPSHLTSPDGKFSSVASARGEDSVGHHAADVSVAHSRRLLAQTALTHLHAPPSPRPATEGSWGAENSFCSTPRVIPSPGRGIKTSLPSTPQSPNFSTCFPHGLHPKSPRHPHAQRENIFRQDLMAGLQTQHSDNASNDNHVPGLRENEEGESLSNHSWPCFMKVTAKPTVDPITKR